jgi:hypothetical protein
MKRKKPLKAKIWQWVESHKLPTAGIVSLLGVLFASCLGYVNNGADSLRTDIYQPLYREIGGMDVAIHSNTMETIYSSDVYQSLTRNGSLGRIPKSLRTEIIRLYEAEGEARSHITPIAHKISVLMPQEIARIRTESDDKAWKEKTRKRQAALAKVHSR